MVLVELVRELSGDPPGSRLAVPSSIGEALVASGAAKVVGNEAAARAHLRKAAKAATRPVGAS